MLFNSYTFVLYFIFVLILVRIIGNWTIRKLFLLGVSYVFYAAWNPPFVILLWFSTFIDWYTAKCIYSSSTERRRKLFLLLSILVNLAMLIYFKYGRFFLENINAVFYKLGLSWPVGTIDVILPVGISFYTFQTMSYTMDVYQHRLRPWHSCLDYALYVTFFPQLIAGPIVRASEFLPQCMSSRLGTSKQIGWGLTLFTVGLFCKVVLADALAAPVVERVYNSLSPLGFLTAWTGTLAFAMQIFYDFFGYSICAIGIALCFGFELPDNFRFPYAAIGFSDFWTRWHISLSSWLRDYLYIPMGGNRHGSPRAYVNLLVTMLLGGLWHGASWMFVIWGALHGIYLILERLIRSTFISRWKFWKCLFGKVFLTALTFFLVCLAWVFFRAPDLSKALSICKAMLNAHLAVLSLSALLNAYDLVGLKRLEPLWLGGMHYNLIVLLSCASLIIHNLFRRVPPEYIFVKLGLIPRAFLLSLMMYAVFVSMTGEDSAFIYFQF